MIKIQLPYDSKLRIDLGWTSGKNPINGLVKPMQELAKSVTKTNSKVREPKIYDEAINNSIHRNRWCKTIDKELWNLDIYQT